MPIFTNPISSQNTATTSGINNYPNFSQIKQNAIYRDSFNRETLNPSNAYNLYTTAADGAGSITIVNQTVCDILTDSTQNNTAQLRTSGFSFSRTDWYSDNRGNINLDILINMGHTGNTQFFLGILFLQPATTISTLPTTARHMGLYLDTSVSPNFKLTSGNGSAQVTTDTGQAQDTNVYRLNIQYTGDDNGLISFYGPATTGANLTPLSTLIKSQTVTSIANSASSFKPTLGFEIFGWVKTLTTAVKDLGILGWNMVVT